MRKVIFLLFFLLTLPIPLFAFPKQAEAQYIQTNTSVYVPSSQVIDQTGYFAGKDLTVNGTVNGDLICFGQDVHINATVTGDILCAAQELTIQGHVLGNIRAAAQTISLSGLVDKNVSVAAQNLTLEANGTITGDLSALAQQTDIQGTVHHDVYGAFQDMTIDGKVGNTVNITDQTLTIGNDAVIGNNLFYRSSQKGQIPNTQAIKGTISYTHIAAQKKTDAQTQYQSMMFSTIYSILAFLLIGIALLLFFKDKTLRIVDELENRPGQSLGWGIVPLFITPVIIILLLLTFIGIPLAAVLLFLWIILLLISRVFVAIYVGQFIIQAITKKKGNIYVALLIGVILLWILFALPYIGWLLSCIAYIMGTGAIVLNIKNNRVSVRQNAEVS